MARVNKNWLEFNGVKSTDPRFGEYGVHVTGADKRIVAKLRGEVKTASGRAGDLFLPDAYDTITVERDCMCTLSAIDEIAAWLEGNGKLRVSEHPNKYWEARVDDKIDFEMVAGGTDPLYKFKLKFTCQPYAHVCDYNGDDPLPFTLYFDENNPSQTMIDLTNPCAEQIIHTTVNGEIYQAIFHVFGTVESLPKLKIYGKGDFDVRVSDGIMRFVGVGYDDYLGWIEDESNPEGGYDDTEQLQDERESDGIVVDSETVDAYNLEMTALRNNKVEGAFFKITANNNGECVLTWTPYPRINDNDTPDDETDDTIDDTYPCYIEKIEVYPRWRCR